MKEFPKPEDFINRVEKPVVVETFTKSGVVSADAVSMILRSELIPEHHEDPNVLKFIMSYVQNRDVKQAAHDAGIHANSGHKLRNRQDIHNAITKITEVAVMKYGFDASEIVEKAKEIAFVDPIEFENPDGTFKHLKDISPNARRAVKKFKAKNLFELDPNGMRVCVGELIEVEFWDKMKGIEMLGREKDLFKETKKVEHDLTSNMRDVLLQSAERAEAAALEARKERDVNVIEVEVKSGEVK